MKDVILHAQIDFLLPIFREYFIWNKRSLLVMFAH